MDIDTNVDHYSLVELMKIMEIDQLDKDSILDSTNMYIQKFKYSDPTLSSFFSDIQDKLLEYANESVEGGNQEEEEDDDEDDPVIQDENPTIRQPVSILDSVVRFPMKQEQIPTTNDTFALPVKQDSLNPNLKNTIKRFINLDSQFRQFSGGTDSQPTNYTCDLSDTLKNTLNLSVYSYQIPYSWYTIDTAYGNTCFWINDVDSGIVVPITISSGNYTQLQFQATLNNVFSTAGFTFDTDPVLYNINNGILTLDLFGGIYNGEFGHFTISTTTQILFFDFSKIKQCQSSCSNKNNYFNNTLGWLMGFRLPYVQVDPSGNSGSCILNLNGTKYLILVIDDYNQNHVNNSLVSISKFSNVLKMPTYYSPDLPYTCISPSQQGNNLDSLVRVTQNGLLLAGKYEEEYTSTQFLLPSAPRTLTNAQLYTINSINNANNNLTNYLTTAPTTADILAIIPVKTSVESTTGTMLVEFSGSLQDNVRTYFGPVDIDRMAVKLMDDKGNILNLNGVDWCVTLLAECLYQY